MSRGDSMKGWPTPRTIVFIHDRNNPRRWVLELPEGVPIPAVFTAVINALGQDPEVENAQLIGRHLHIWLTPACQPNSWDERIGPLIVMGASAAFDWHPQPTAVERESNRPMPIIP